MDVAGRACTLTLTIAMLTHSTFAAPDLLKHIDQVLPDKIFFYKHIKEIYFLCLFPYSNTIINPMGDIYPCLSYKMGNIKEQKLIDIINNTKYRCFRKNLKHSKIFSSCQMCCELKIKNGDLK